MSYSNPIRYGVALPEQVPQLVVGCFHPTGLVTEVGVWRKLIQSLDPEPQFTVLLVGGWSKQELQQAVPASLFNFLEVRPDKGWTDLIEPDKPTRSFAMVSIENQARILVLGIPTEETWEEFQSHLRAT